jgi:preprotein translocase subunit SecG
MFDFMRDRGSTAEDKRREALNAYLDSTLTPSERKRFEAQLARDPGLRADLEQLRVLKLQMRNMPRRRVPRSFALDPAVYGRPKSQPLMQLYPALRSATALAVFFLIFTLALGAFQGQFQPAGDGAMPAMVSDAIQESGPAAEDAALVQEAPVVQPESRREGTPGEPEIDIASEAGVAEGDADLLLQDYPEALATMETASIPEVELQAYEAPPAEDSFEIVAVPEGETSESLGLEETVAQQAGTASLLRSIQVALATILVLLLVLVWLARRQANRI